MIGTLPNANKSANDNKPEVPPEWHHEKASVSFARAYGGEGSYYCPACGSNQGSVWIHDHWRPTKWQALCLPCRKGYR